MELGILFQLFALLVAVLARPDPGIRLRISSNTINKALRIAEVIVNDKLANAKLPGVRMHVDVGPGTGRLDVRKLLISDFAAPKYHYEPMPPSAAQWTATNGSITIKGAWSARYNYLVQVSTDGFFIATVSNLTMSTAIEILKGADGRAEVTIPNCQADVDEIKVKFVGGTVSKIMHGLRGGIEDALLTVVREKMCQLIQTNVATKMNEKLQSRPAFFPIPIANHTFGLKYNLAEDPKVTNEYLDIPIDGRITHQGDQDLAINSSMIDSSDHENMIYLWISESVPQSLVQSIYKAGLMKFEVNRNTTPQFLAGLRTTCYTSECFGSKLKEMGELFPDNYAVIEIWVFEQPTVKFVEGKVIVDSKLMLKVYVEPKSNETLCLVAQIDTSTKFQPYFRQQRLFSKMTFEKFELNLNETRVGEIPGAVLYIVGDIVSANIQEKVNLKLTQNPLDFGKIEGLRLMNNKVKVHNGVFQMSSDFTYEPTLTAKL